jgi:nucleoside-diphosphate-sugar epimerase
VKALVTGASGFIGSHLVSKLVKEGWAVHVVVRDRQSAWRLDNLSAAITAHSLDLEDKRSVQQVVEQVRPEAVFHLAASRKRQMKEGNASHPVHANVIGTLNLLEATVRVGEPLKVFINTGSSEEYGTATAPFHEEQRECPVSEYSASKVAATHLCEMYHRRYKLPTVTLRPFLVYGPAQGNDMFVPSLIQHCLDGRDFEMTTGDQLREFHYVDDVTNAFLLAASNRAAIGQIINVGTGSALSIGTVARLVVTKVGTSTRLLMGAIPKRSCESDLYCDGGKAKTLLTWEPRVNLEEGLERTITWYRKIQYPTIEHLTA